MSWNNTEVYVVVVVISRSSSQYDMAVITATVKKVTFTRRLTKFRPVENLCV